MEICPTFVPGLFAIRFNGETFDELERLFGIWDDTERLAEFFMANEQDLGYFEIGVVEAVMETVDLRDELRDLLLDEDVPLDRIFVSLHNQEAREPQLSKKKAKRKWLRLYAIKIAPGKYVVTGGCIKLTHLMEDREHTAAELAKQEKCRNYLRETGVFDDDSFMEFMELDI